MALNIRKMTLEDIPEVVKIEEEIFSTESWNEAQFHYEITTNPVSLPYVLTLDNKVIGYYSIWKMFDYASIATIAIAKEYQGNGYGQLLMTDLLEKCRYEGMKSVDLEVRISNIKAINLYKKNGFELSHIRKGYYSDGEDAYFMIKKLGSEEDE